MKCERCGVTIADDKIAMPNRCLDWRCPTMPDNLRWESPEKRRQRAEGIASVTSRIFARRCAEIGVDCHQVDSALAALAEHEAFDALPDSLPQREAADA